MSTSSTAHRVAEAQAVVQHGMGPIGGEARAPKPSEARAVVATTEVEMAEARAPGSIEAEAVGTEAGRALAPPLV